jgi:hypothetical protein
MRALSLLCLLALLGGCGDDEEPVRPTPPPPEDTGGGDADLPDGTDDATPNDTNDDTSPTDTSDPTDVDIHDGADGDDTNPDVPDPIDADTGDTDTADVDPTEACLRACGIGCPAPMYQPCTSDEQRYYSICVLECYGLEPRDAGDCAPDDTLCPTPSGTLVDGAEWTPPEGCSFDRWRGWMEPEYTSDEALLDVLFCDDDTPLGIDWSTHRVVTFSYSDNPESELVGVWIDEEDGYTGLMRAPAYCGGAAPPTLWSLALLPADGRPVQTESCMYGTCAPGPPRP